MDNRKKNSFEEDEKIILSQNISRDDSKIGLIKRGEFNSVFNKLNLNNLVNKVAKNENQNIKKSFSHKSYKEDESSEKEESQVSVQSKSQGSGKNYESAEDNEIDQEKDYMRNEGSRQLIKKEKL